VVIGKGEIHHWSDFDLAVDGNWLVLDSVKTQHGGLWKVDDGSAHERAKDTSIGDSEGATSHVFDGELVVACL